jgi:hypothetical protein
MSANERQLEMDEGKLRAGQASRSEQVTTTMNAGASKHMHKCIATHTTTNEGQQE